MDDKDWSLILAVLAITLGVMESKRVSKIQREIDLIVSGDLETLKLKRKLDGYPEPASDG